MPPNAQRVALATHYWALGPAFALKRYLETRTEVLQFIGHPMHPGKSPALSQVYTQGRVTSDRQCGSAVGHGRYHREVWRTVKWIQDQHRPYDVFVAGDSLLALAGLWLRRRGTVGSVILYTVDYVPRRFKNTALNRAYHLIDRLVVNRVDAVWNVTQDIQEARRSRDGKVARSPQIVVPVGANVEQVSRRPTASFDPHRMVFLGHLLEKQGLQLAIAALPLIKETVDDASLLVIGDGPFAAELRELTRKFGVSDSVEFIGALYDDEQIESRVSSSGLGLAPYTPDPQSFSRFADPGKIKTYLACGIPVLVTDVPPIAAEIQRQGAGRIIEFDAGALREAAIAYLSSSSEMDRGRRAARRLGSTFSWDLIFDEAWRRSRPYLRITT